MATLKDVLVPDIGDFSDVPVTELLVSPGDEVALEDPLVVVESDKATMEIPSPFAGTVSSLEVAVGDTVSEGAKIAVLSVEGAGEESQAEAGADRTPGETSEEQRPPSTEAAAASSVASAVVAEAQAAPASDARDAERVNVDSPSLSEGQTTFDVHASPVVRRLAREKGIDLSSVTGSGRNGRVTKEDLEGAGTGSTEAQPTAASPAAKLPAAGEGTREPLSRIQQISARNLSAAWQTIPHVTHHDDADITELEAFRKQLNGEQKDVKVTMVALLLKACAAALDEFPRFASSLDGEELVVKAERHIAFAADTPKGLMVPVVRDVDQKGLLELAGELTTLSGKGPRRQARAEGAERRGLHHLLARRHRRHRVHPDREPAPGGDPRRRAIGHATGVGRRGVPAPDGASALALLRPPGDRRCRRRPLHRAPGATSHRPAEGAAVIVEVPDIGDFTDVPVVELLVNVGDTVAVEDPLVVLETDKASFEVPAPEAGKVVELLVEVGSLVQQSAPIVKLELTESDAAEQPDEPAGRETQRAAERARGHDEPGAGPRARGPDRGDRADERGPRRCRRPRRGRRRTRAVTQLRSGPPTSGWRSCSWSATNGSAASA